MAEPCGYVTPQLFCAGFSRFLLAPSGLQPRSRDNVRGVCGVPCVSREARAAGRAPEAPEARK